MVGWSEIFVVCLFLFLYFIFCFFLFPLSGESVEMVKKIIDDVKDDDEELEMLLDEIPQATSPNLVRRRNRHV